MKAALRGKYTCVPSNLPDATKQILVSETEPMYWQIKLSPLVRQDGLDFSWLVIPLKFTHELKGEQTGAAVLCQTEAEAKETFEVLRERDKKHLVAVQMAGFGTVGWAYNLRRYVNEIGVRPATSPEGEKVWLAFERETDQDTLEVKVIRHKKTTSQGESDFWARKWLAEYNQKKKSFSDSIGKTLTPLPPPRCTKLTPTEIQSLATAKDKALKKQWPRCFDIFEKVKTSPDAKIPDQQIEDAYVLDLVANGADLRVATDDGKKLRPDMELVLALGNAAKNYAKRGKSKITDTAMYLIAFTWELGWCYLPYDQLAEKLGVILETPFTPEQVKYFVHSLGFYTKHKSGPPEKSP